MVEHGLLSCAGLCVGSRPEFCRSYFYAPIQREQASHEKFDREDGFESIGFEISHKEYEISCLVTFIRD
jgi:hypothetical protein